MSMVSSLGTASVLCDGILLQHRSALPTARAAPAVLSLSGNQPSFTVSSRILGQTRSTDLFLQPPFLAQCLCFLAFLCLELLLQSLFLHLHLLLQKNSSSRGSHQRRVMPHQPLKLRPPPLLFPRLLHPRPLSCSLLHPWRQQEKISRRTFTGSSILDMRATTWK